jgi:hypothetical protein
MTFYICVIIGTNSRLNVNFEGVCENENMGLTFMKINTKYLGKLVNQICFGIAVFNYFFCQPKHIICK